MTAQTHISDEEAGAVLPDRYAEHAIVRGEAAASTATATGTAARRNTTNPPGALFLGVIVWTDDPGVDPTVIADRNPVVLARAVAVTIHEMLEDSETYAGATAFLQSNPPPQDWVLPEDVDAWLEALRETTPHPAYGSH